MLFCIDEFWLTEPSDKTLVVNNNKHINKTITDNVNK